MLGAKLYKVMVLFECFLLQVPEFLHAVFNLKEKLGFSWWSHICCKANMQPLNFSSNEE